MEIEMIKQILETRMSMTNGNETEKSLLFELLKMSEELEKYKRLGTVEDLQDMLI